MKQRSATPVSIGLATKAMLVATAVLMAIAVPLATMQRASADDLQSRIDTLQRQIEQSQGQANKLHSKATTLQDAVAQLSAQKNAIQKQLDLTQSKFDTLQRQIKDTEQRISDNKDALGTTMADLYVDGTISPMEMLASSKNIGDYVDKQTYQTSIRDTLSQTIDKIKSLKEDLNKQQVAVQRTLVDQQNARRALAEKESEKNRLLSDTKGKEASYKELTAAQETEKGKLQEQQQAAIRAAMSGGAGTLSGGGSLASYASWVGGCNFDSIHAVSYNNDPLGYGCNQCVSYAAYMMMIKTGYAPSYWGNANMWPNSATGSRFRVDSSPGDNSLGVISAGQYGHIVYVKAYHPESNTVDISQYNEWLPGQDYGHYSERYGVSASTYDKYIHF